MLNFIAKSRILYHFRNTQIKLMSAEPVSCACKRTKSTAPKINNMATVPKKIISSPHAPKAVGPYSQAIALDKTLYVSGCLGLNPDTMKLVEGGVAAEAKQALTSLGHILDAAGTNYGNVVKTTVFLDDINDFATVNEVYKQFFTKDFPARSCFQVGKLPVGAKVEIEAIVGLEN